jgi:hypothetical protein
MGFFGQGQPIPDSGMSAPNRPGHMHRGLRRQLPIQICCIGSNEFGWLTSRGSEPMRAMIRASDNPQPRKALVCVLQFFFLFQGWVVGYLTLASRPVTWVGSGG